MNTASVKGADTVGARTRRLGTGKHSDNSSPQRHVVVDTLGLPVLVGVTSARLRDRTTTFRCTNSCGPLSEPNLLSVLADGGYAGRLVTAARARLPPGQLSSSWP